MTIICLTTQFGVQRAESLPRFLDCPNKTDYYIRVNKLSVYTTHTPLADTPDSVIRSLSVHYVMIFIISDFLSVDETAKEPPQKEDGINTPQRLAMEATYINQALSQQLLMVTVFVWM